METCTDISSILKHFKCYNIHKYICKNLLLGKQPRDLWKRKKKFWMKTLIHDENLLFQNLLPIADWIVKNFLFTSAGIHKYTQSATRWFKKKILYSFLYSIDIEEKVQISATRCSENYVQQPSSDKQIL